MAFLLRGARYYSQLSQKHPYKVACISTGILMVAGDTIAQFAIERRRFAFPKNEAERAHCYDKSRTFRWAFFGALMAGPFLHTWFHFLSRRFAATRYGPLKMVVLDQVFCMPSLMAALLGTMALFRGDSSEEIKHTYRDTWPYIVLRGYMVWPAAQLFNFYILPLEHRLLFVNFVALFWNTFLAWRSEKRGESHSH
jgi:protein Mpv17